MKRISDFYLRRDELEKLEQETLEDGKTKYHFADGSYIIAEKEEPHCIQYFTKYETDGSQKVYRDSYDNPYLLLDKVIDADGQEVCTLKHWKNRTARIKNSINIEVKSGNVRELYTFCIEKFDPYFYHEGEQYALQRRNVENGVERRVKSQDSESSYFEIDAKDMISPKEKKDRPLVEERYPDGRKRIYEVDNLATAEKLVAFEGDARKEFAKFLISEKLADGTRRVWDDKGHIEYEKIPNIGERKWENGVLKEEKIVLGPLNETFKYIAADEEDIAILQEFIKEANDDGNTKMAALWKKVLTERLAKNNDITSETLEDGTVCTLYKGRLISENHPDGTHNTVTAQQGKKGVWYISRPDGTPLLEWQSDCEYKKWAENGNLEEKASGGFTYRYDTEKGNMISVEGADGIYMVEENSMRGQFQTALKAGDMKEAKNLFCEPTRVSRM